MLWLSLVLLVCLIGITVWLWRERKKLRSQISTMEDQGREQSASQAQIMHTTKLASLGQMMAGIAHEMNTPLGFVRSNVEVIAEMLDEYKAKADRLAQATELLVAASDTASYRQARQVAHEARRNYAEDQTTEEAKDLLQDATEGLVQLTSLVVNLKGFARVDRDGLDSIDLNECLESAMTIANHQLKDRIQVVREFGDLPKVRCIPSQMNQVFLNLITNAAQAMGEEGTLTMRSRRSGSFVEVEVVDTGPGIPEDILPKIFDPFFTTKPVGEGTGLGLSIVHKIIKSHGGDIRADSVPGEGATFIVSLPVARAV